MGRGALCPTFKCCLLRVFKIFRIVCLTVVNRIHNILALSNNCCENCEKAVTDCIGSHCSTIVRCINLNSLLSSLDPVVSSVITVFELERDTTIFIVDVGNKSRSYIVPLATMQDSFITPRLVLAEANQLSRSGISNTSLLAAGNTKIILVAKKQGQRIAVPAALLIKRGIHEIHVCVETNLSNGIFCVVCEIIVILHGLENQLATINCSNSTSALRLLVDSLCESSCN